VSLTDGYNNCFTPWPDMGQAIRVYATDGPSPTISSHHVLILQELEMNEESRAEMVTPIRTSNTKANGMNVGEPGDPMYTLDTGGSMAVGYVLCFDGKRNDDFRMFEDYYPTLTQMMGTGGNNVPMIIHDIPRTEATEVENIADTQYQRVPPETGDDTVAALTVCDLTKGQGSHQSIGSGFLQVYALPQAYSIREDAKANNFHATPTDTALCVNALQPSPQSHHAQIFIVQVEEGRNA